jgi:hypothetical protein
MTRREWQQVAIIVLTAALGVLVVRMVLNGVVEQALIYGAAIICAIAGMVCLGLAFLVGRAR